uniref:Putative glycine-rich cell wall structural protein 1.8 n=1 Tax=Amblyomma tuberculatum TaxID=48802 RepID=A0A6M2E7A1_9ACAR
MMSLRTTALLASLLVCHGFGDSQAQFTKGGSNGVRRSLRGGFGYSENAGNGQHGGSRTWITGLGDGSNAGGDVGVGSGSGGGSGLGGGSGYGAGSNGYFQGAPAGFWRIWRYPSYTWSWETGQSGGNQGRSGWWVENVRRPGSGYTWGSQGGRGSSRGSWGAQGQGNSGGQGGYGRPWGEQVLNNDQVGWIGQNTGGQFGGEEDSGVQWGFGGEPGEQGGSVGLGRFDSPWIGASGSGETGQGGNGDRSVQDQIVGYGGRGGEQWGQRGQSSWQGSQSDLTGGPLGFSAVSDEGGQGGGLSGNNVRVINIYGPSGEQGSQGGSYPGIGAGQNNLLSGLGSLNGQGGRGGLLAGTFSSGDQEIGGFGGSGGFGQRPFPCQRNPISQERLRHLHRIYQDKGLGMSFIQFLQQLGIPAVRFGGPAQYGSTIWYWPPETRYYWTLGPQIWTWGSQSGLGNRNGFGAGSGVGMGGMYGGGSGHGSSGGSARGAGGPFNARSGGGWGSTGVENGWEQHVTY